MIHTQFNWSSVENSNKQSVSNVTTKVSSSSDENITTYDLFGKVSAETGGLMFKADKNYNNDLIKDILNFINEKNNPDRVLIVKRKVSITQSETKAFDFPIDNYIDKSLHLLLNSVKGIELTEAMLTSPSGVVMKLSDETLPFENIGTVASIDLTLPETGVWTLSLNGDFNGDLKVFGVSSLKAKDFRLFDKRSGTNVRGAKLPVSGSPVSGSFVETEIQLSKIVYDGEISLINADDSLIQSYIFSSDFNTKLFNTDIQIPEESFYIQVSGETQEGSLYSRVVSSLITPQKIGLKLLGNEINNFNSRIAYASGVTTLKFEVFNGYDESIRIYPSFKKKPQYATLEYSDDSFEVESKGYAEISIDLIVPFEVSDNTKDSLILSISPTSQYKANMEVSLTISAPPIFINGDEFSNELVGYDNDNIIKAYESDDILKGHKGNDKLFGAAGIDELFGEEGNDLLDGGTEDDTLYGGAGNDELYGGLGDDVLKGGIGNDSYYYFVGDGNDTIYDSKEDDGAPMGIDTLYLHGIDPDSVLLRRATSLNIILSDGTKIVVHNEFTYAVDTISPWAIDFIVFDNGTIWDYATIQQKILVGTDNDDAINGNSEDDVINAGTGDDVINSYSGNDIIHAGEGNDTIDGLYGDDIIYGDAGNDIINDIYGANQLYGGLGSDVIFGIGELYGNEGEDELNATGAASLYGGEGNDFLNGSSESDKLYGGEGDDILIADLNYQDGSDNELTGGKGADTIYGGTGNDSYFYNQGDGYDTIIETRFSEAYSNNNISTGDRLLFGQGIEIEDVSFQRYSDDMLIKFNHAGDFISIPNWFVTFNDTNKDYFKINQFIFANGDILSDVDVENKIYYYGIDDDDRLYGYRDRNEKLYGLMGNDDITGGEGSDQLFGGEGDDRYFYSFGDGLDVISEENGNDTLIIRGGLGFDDANIEYLKHNDDLVIRLNQDSQQEIRVVNQFLGGSWSVEALGHSEVTNESNGFTYSLISMTSINSRLKDYATGVPIDDDSTNNLPPELSIVSPAEDISITVGESISLQATANDNEDGNISSAIRWSSNLDGDLGIGAQIQVTLSSGSHQITAAIIDSNSQNDSASISIQVGASQGGMNSSVVVPAGESSAQVTIDFVETQEILNGLASFSMHVITSPSYFSDFSIGFVSWQGNTISLYYQFNAANDVPAGNYELVLRYSFVDASGIELFSRDVNVAIIVPASDNTSPALSIITPTEGSVIAVGGETVLTANASDNEDGDLSSQINWSSSIDGELGSGSSLAVQLSPGSHTIQAQVTDSNGSQVNVSIDLQVEGEQVSNVFDLNVTTGTTSAVALMTIPLDSSVASQLASYQINISNIPSVLSNYQFSFQGFSGTSVLLGVQVDAAANAEPGVYDVPVSISFLNGQSDTLYVYEVTVRTRIVN